MMHALFFFWKNQARKIRLKSYMACLGKLFWSFHSIYWNGQNGLKMVWNGLEKNDVEWFDFVNFEGV